jgi:putative tricarboxylic transport membrane protein
MDLFANLALGFQTAATLFNLFFCLLGALIGTLIGVLPGIGPVSAVALLLPFTFALPPETALIMLAGIYYGAQYGGSTTAILMNLPGEASSVVTAVDGHAMARAGRAGAALSVAAIGSFVAGCLATVVVAAFGPPLSGIAQQFAAADNFSLMVLGLVAAVVLAHGSLAKAIAMVLLGVLLGLVGGDPHAGTLRLTLGLDALADGIGFIPVAMGIFGVAEILRNLERGGAAGAAVAQAGTLLPTRAEWRRAWPAMLRGTGIGSALGVLPGGGAVLSSFASYALEKKVARQPERFGRGAIEGVAGPESANNAGAQTSFIPMLTLGIPSNPVMAMMIGALTIHGISPGPRVIAERPELFWGVIASMWIGNLMLLVINLPMVGLWVRLLAVPYRMLYPAILLFSCVGVYALGSSTFDVILIAVFGLFGYLLLKLGFEPAPLLLGFVLAPMLEENLRRALLLSRGDPSVFVERPISLGLLVVSVVLILAVAVPAIRRGRRDAFAE